MFRTLNEGLKGFRADLKPENQPFPGRYIDKFCTFVAITAILVCGLVLK